MWRLGGTSVEDSARNDKRKAPGRLFCSFMKYFRTLILTRTTLTPLEPILRHTILSASESEVTLKRQPLAHKQEYKITKDPEIGMYIISLQRLFTALDR